MDLRRSGRVSIWPIESGIFLRIAAFNSRSSCCRGSIELGGSSGWLLRCNGSGDDGKSCGGFRRLGGGASSEPRRVCRVDRRVGSSGDGSAVLRRPALDLCIGGGSQARPRGRGTRGCAASLSPSSSPSLPPWLARAATRSESPKVGLGHCLGGRPRRGAGCGAGGCAASSTPPPPSSSSSFPPWLGSAMTRMESPNLSRTLPCGFWSRFDFFGGLLGFRVLSASLGPL